MSAGGPIDYRTLVTSEHNVQPDFMATVDLVANQGLGAITTLLEGLPALFDLDTAIGDQEDVDGEWIGFSRFVAGVLLVQFFGFADDATALTFGELGNAAVGGRFIELGEDASATSTLSDPEYRLTLQAKILQNFWNGTVGQLEAAAADLIPVTCRYFDPGDGVVMILPAATLDQTLYQLLTTYDLLPRPGGVRYQLVQPVSPLSWITVGTASVANGGLTVQKLSGSSAWDSSAYLALPSNHVYMEWVDSGPTRNYMGGLAANPSGSPNYPTLNFAIYATTSNFVYVFESGVDYGPYGTYSPGDRFAVYYDGTAAVYLHNGVIFRVSKGSPGALSPMFCIYDLQSVASSIAVFEG